MLEDFSIIKFFSTKNIKIENKYINYNNNKDFSMNF